MSNIICGALLLFCALCFGFLSYKEIKDKSFDSIGMLVLLIIMGVACLAAGIGAITGWF